jgi:hypothetical protein
VDDFRDDFTGNHLPLFSGKLKRHEEREREAEKLIKNRDKGRKILISAFGRSDSSL